MKKVISFVLVLILIFALSGCASQKKTPTQIIQSFFSDFESADYASMKAYCTENCIESYFHDGDVNGMVWARLKAMGEEELSDDRIVHIFVSVEMEASTASALYPETNTSFYVEFLRGSDDAWLINGFPTGK